MAIFKVGQRVRCVVGTVCRGREASILYAEDGVRDDGRRGLYYLIKVDGVGEYNPTNNRRIAAFPDEIEPLVPPKDEAWEAFKTLVCTPDPVLVNEKV
jgi:hypothetical protein